jgi:glucose 1-dehydrogenase
LTIQCDVSDEASVERAFDQAQALGRPNILINSAGLNQSGVKVADMSLAQWRRLLDTDLTGSFLTCRRFIRDLRAANAAGRIVNISSIHAEVVRAGAADYASAKAGLRNLTRTLALECAPLQINVNAIEPGMILTPMNARAETDAAYRAQLESNIPWGRAGRADEVAQLALYLCSPEAGYVTGASFVIDGGLSLVLGQGA